MVFLFLFVSKFCIFICMIRLRDLLAETKISPEAQDLIDILAMWSPENPRFKRYYDLLKKEYGIDFNKINNDDYYIKNVELSNIKSKTDFLSWNNYIKYATNVYKQRNINISFKTNKVLTFDEAKVYLSNIGVPVKHKKYNGSGNYAQVIGNEMTISDEIDVGTLIHELGHVYDNTKYKDGISKLNTNASSYYGIGKSNEVFAENFTHFFMTPSTLKSKLPEVYNDLNNRISSKWKSNINKLMKL